MSKWLFGAKEESPSEPIMNSESYVDETERTILVVDDDTGVREALSDLLRVLGYKVVLASNGTHALELLQTGCRPFIVLLDLAMPGMDGLEFRHALHQHAEFKDLQIVVITAAPNQKAEVLGVTDVLEKPVPLERLLKLLESVGSSA